MCVWLILRSTPDFCPTEEPDAPVLRLGCVAFLRPNNAGEDANPLASPPGGHLCRRFQFDADQKPGGAEALALPDFRGFTTRQEEGTDVMAQGNLCAAPGCRLDDFEVAQAAEPPTSRDLRPEHSSTPVSSREG